jgi:ketosteroid isomerase-like protein
MAVSSIATETVVRNHLMAFVEGKPVGVIVSDYADDAVFCTEARIYRGRQEIHGFFEGFITSLPAQAVNRFMLRRLWVDGNIAYITWQVGDDIPLGTDTFVVDNGKIVSQTFAMYAASAQ